MFTRSIVLSILNNATLSLFKKNHRLANWQTLVFGHTFGELDAHLASVTHTSRAQGRKKKRTKRDSPLKEKGRADEELEDGHRHGPAFRYRGHPSKHTTDREHFFSEKAENLGLRPFRPQFSFYGNESAAGRVGSYGGRPLWETTGASLLMGEILRTK